MDIPDDGDGGGDGGSGDGNGDRDDDKPLEEKIEIPEMMYCPQYGGICVLIPMDDQRFTNYIWARASDYGGSFKKYEICWTDKREYCEWVNAPYDFWYHITGVPMQGTGIASNPAGDSIYINLGHAKSAVLNGEYYDKTTTDFYLGMGKPYYQMTPGFHIAAHPSRNIPDDTLFFSPDLTNLPGGGFFKKVDHGYGLEPNQFDIFSGIGFAANRSFRDNYFGGESHIWGRTYQVKVIPLGIYP